MAKCLRKEYGGMMGLEDIELLDINKIVEDFNLIKKRLESKNMFESRIRKILDSSTHACLLNYEEFEMLVDIILNLNGEKYKYKTFQTVAQNEKQNSK